jgi:hypothetical protein
MIQRLIYGVLRQGFNQVLAAPQTLERYLQEQWELSVTEAKAASLYFTTHPLKIVHGYPHTNLAPPIFSIILAGEREEQQMLGMSGGLIDDPNSPDFGAEGNAAVWRHTYQILSLGENPDLTSYYYEVAKRILALAKPFLVTKNLLDIQISGQELAPDPQYTGEVLFGRTIGFTCRSVFEIPDFTTKGGRAWQVSGIAVDSNGSPSDVGGAKTLVTVS